MSRAQRAALLACLIAAALAALVAVATVAPTRVAAAAATADAAPAPGDYSVTLEQCLSSSARSERSATFVAEMVGTAATQKMAMKIGLEERLRGEAEYHLVSAPGLGAWKAAEADVKIYKYVKQVTNLAAQASYRAVVKFHWVGDKGKVIKRAELRSSRCFQPALAPSR